MKRAISDIPKYDLKKFKSVHRVNGEKKLFGNNYIDASKTIDGFEMYSSEGLVHSIGPLKSDFYRVSITLQGSLDMQIGLDSYPHQSRTLAFTFPNQIFSKANFSTDIFGYYILFNSDFLNDILPSIKIADEFPFYSLSGTPVFRVTVHELEAIINLLMKINEELHHINAGREKAIKMYLYLLLLEAKRSYDRQDIGNESEISSETYQLVSRFRKLVAVHYQTKRQVSDYAGILGVSPNHLNKAVKEQSGMTASDAIREMLLQEAKSLLRYTDNSVAEIAYRLDFSEPASFNRFFKSNTGETPFIFRKKNN